MDIAAPAQDRPPRKDPELHVRAISGKSAAETAAHVHLSPQVGALHVVLNTTHSTCELNPNAVVDTMEKAGAAASRGDLSELESMLAIQARTLDGLFTSLAARAGVAGTHERMESLLRLALKAQSQARTTVESLAVIKQGPAVFARQANINNGGQQQVNNGVPTSPEATASRARSETKNPRTELLEAPHGERLVTRAKSKAGRTDPDLEAVGEVNGTPKPRGQGARRSKPLSGSAA